MLIGELAQQAGLTLDTIRFYEKKGLLDTRHLTRRESRYREYSPTALERLQFIVRAKSVGFTLSEIVQWLSDWDTLTPQNQREVLQNKIGQINRRITELEDMNAYLSAKLAASNTE